MTTLRRNLKNTVNNYTDIQCKVREATCNEPWGPAASVMTEIADATYSVVEFAEIMDILWKRANDHGKNWRHVYKSLVVLDYIVKTGSERVAQQCKEHIYSLLTLQDFRFNDKDGKDQGVNVREKAKQLVALLKDEERLKSERKKALQAKERFAQNSTGIGSHMSRMPKSSMNALTRSEYPPRHAPQTDAGPSESALSNAMEAARPSDRDEEQMQLELALAISKEEAEKDRQEQEQFRATLERSKTETRLMSINDKQKQQGEKPTLLSLSQKPPARPPPPAVQSNVDPWGMPISETVQPVDNPPRQTAILDDPWSAQVPSTSHENNTSNNSRFDPFGPSQPSNEYVDNWLLAPSTVLQPPAPPTLLNPVVGDDLLGDMQNFDPFGPQTMKPAPQGQSIIPAMTSTSTTLPPSSKMASILDNRTKHLVNIDNLIANQTPTAGPTNPFASSGASVFNAQSTNPFLVNLNNSEPAPTLNQLKNTNGSSATNPFC